MSLSHVKRLNQASRARERGRGTDTLNGSGSSQSHWAAKSDFDSDCCVGRHISISKRGKRAVAEHFRSVAVSWNTQNKKQKQQIGYEKKDKKMERKKKVAGSSAG
eukprot:GHVU01003063.1.p1 GENE.GHVU01003063.1~~GHVU01003063.1.p1  ORF type:complete len:105 (-),score=15.27 GHVU01003063.1:525-839(-)